MSEPVRAVRSDRSSGAAAFDPEPWRGELRSFVRRMGAAAEADDVVQEVFLRAVKNPPGGETRAWLFCVALNILRDRGRRSARAGRVLPRAAHTDAGTVQDPARMVENRDLAARAWDIVQDLPDQQRASLVLRVHRQLTYREVALALGCSEATARQHFYLGMKAVRAALAGDLDD